MISAADTISHEVGHTLNLEHDGYEGSDGSEEYYEGHSAGKEFWVPIMGSADSPTISQWSKGEYYNANQTEGDLVIISESGISLTSDDYGNSSATAHPVTLGQQMITLGGVISQYNDIDVFTINFTDLGSLRFESKGDTFSTNRDVRMRIYDSSNTLLTDYNSDETKGAATDLLLQAGTYEVWIEGDGAGSPASNPPTGWTDYGSLGDYNLILTPAPLSRAAALDNFGVSLTDSGTLLGLFNQPYHTMVLMHYKAESLQMTNPQYSQSPNKQLVSASAIRSARKKTLTFFNSGSTTS